MLVARVRFLVRAPLLCQGRKQSRSALLDAGIRRLGLRFRLRSPLSPLALVPLLLIACGEATPTPMGPEVPEVPTSPPANMDAYLGGLPAWEAFSPLLADFDGAVGEPSQFEEMVNDKAFSCTSTPYSLTQTPEKVVTLNPDVEVLWPGSLLQGSGYVGGIGSLAELPVRQRAPIRLSIDREPTP